MVPSSLKRGAVQTMSYTCHSPGFLQALTNGIEYASADGVFVFGTDVYVAGSESGFSGGARLWKNGVSVSLPASANGGYANSVFVK